MKTTATVIKTEEGKAHVRVMRNSACEGCDGCANKGSCHTEMLLSDTPRFYELDVKNDIGAKSGDMVEISSSGNRILIFAVILFLVPVVSSVISYFIAESLLDLFYPVVVSGGVFVIAFVMVAFLLNKVIALYSANSISKIIKENSGGAVYTNAYKE